jgi:2,4-dienoyl-CoA reductase-like NADH-dependent reductase (Old Yellow Enzyme family)/putative sterol carrier protein/thioredoxin reductase
MVQKLFEPFEINGMELKNRIGFAPMLNMPGIWTSFAVTDETIEWFEVRARGGAGLVMTGTFGPMLLDLPGALEPFAKMADAVHAHGAKLGVQIGDGGPMTGQGPSPMPYPDELDPKQSQFEIMLGQLSPFPGIESVQEFTVDQIEQHTEKFAGYAVALKDAGVDCVELHCAHGGATLFCSFISPYYNRRQDEYGGSWENRLRFPTKVLRRMREAVGPDYPILARISADELLGAKGITLEDTTEEIVPALEAAGVDCFDVSQGSILHAPEGITIPLYYSRGCYIHNAEAVKKATGLPVIGVGRIVERDMAEAFLEEEKADLIYLGRQLTSDPETPNKWLEGRDAEVRICIGCLEGCGTPCPVNYDISPEALPLEPAAESRIVLVIGGGVAGMEAARVSALRGHKVTLMEKGSELGGTVAALALDPLTAEFGCFIDFLRVQMDMLNIDVRLDTEVGAAEVEALKPDAVIMATGASLTIPARARDKPGVFEHIEALHRRSEIGQKVVVWGLMYGAELAISLAEEGKDVVLIGKAGEATLNAHAADIRKYWVRRKLTDINCSREGPASARVDNPRVLFHVDVKTIENGKIEVESEDGQRSVLAYDTLVVSRGRKKNDDLFDEIESKAPEVYKIGDCSVGGNILKAVWSANEAARKIGSGRPSEHDEGSSTMTEQTMGPEEFKQLVEGKTDEEILAVTGGNEEALLAGVLDSMKAAFDPTAAAGQSAVFQYVFDTAAGEMHYHLDVADGACEVAKGMADNPRVTLAISLPDFLRLMIGELNGMQAFTTGKLKISGDVMFSQVLGSWFKAADA